MLSQPLSAKRSKKEMGAAAGVKSDSGGDGADKARGKDVDAAATDLRLQLRGK